MTEFELNQEIREHKAQCSMLLNCVDYGSWYDVWFKEAVELPESKFIKKYGAKDGHYYLIKGQKRFLEIAKNYPDWETNY